ncbi:IclR family transcriptional regulator [Halopenitus sp. POP-27]|uniref:IclR family transcriptional regulator n=1 Tax=Halopenitus sp. POP-27 TaxID=2994425 RepID=UPI002468924E|nr:IclR family transcriptional regulator [Halopenitus sp. POP-27]
MNESTPPMQSVERAFEVVETLRDNGPAGPSRIAEELGMPKSTAYVYLRSLRETGFVIGEDGQYRLSYMFLNTGSRIKHRQRIFQVARGDISRLANETGESVTLSIEEAGRTIVLQEESKEESIDLGLYSGMSAPLHSQAAGKTILAELPPSRITDIIDSHGLTAATTHTITDEKRLRDQLETIRETGYAVDWDQHVVGVGTMGVPIVVEGEPIGAIGIACPTERMKDEDYQEDLLKLARECTESITVSYQYSR